MEKIDYKNKDLILAENLNEMQDAIIELETQTADIAEDVAENKSALAQKLDKSGGTIVTDNFGDFSIKRANNWTSAIKFENSKGVLGYLGMADVDGNLHHTFGSDSSKTYSILDSNNYNSIIGNATTGKSGLMSSSDKSKLDSIGSLITISKTLTITTSWTDTGIAGSDLPGGSLVVQVSGLSEPETSCYGEIWTGFMSWYTAYTTNDSDTDEIILHKAGHASNGRNIYLRTVRTRGANTYFKLQIAANMNLSSSQVIFKFRKLI